MKKINILTLLCLILFIPSVAISGNWTGNFNILLGAKLLDEDEWEPVEEHNEVGISFDFRQTHWPISITFAYLTSEDDGSAVVFVPGYGWTIGDFDAETREINVGVKKIWDVTEIIKPFAGGGLSFINAEFTGTTFGRTRSQDDDAVGIWIGGGIMFTLAKHLNLGFQAGYSYAEVELFGVDANAGGSHGLFVIGFHW